MKVRIFSSRNPAIDINKFLDENYNDVNIKFVTQSESASGIVTISVFYEEIDLQDTGVM